MDPSPQFYVIAGIVIALLLVLMTARQIIAIHKLRQHLRWFPGPARSPHSYEISPLELAYLRGGTVRVGEVALLDLLLSGCGRVRPKDGNITLTGAPSASTVARDPVRGATLGLLRHGEWVPASRVIAEVSGKGPIIDGLRFDLAERGLLALSEETTRLVNRFHATREKFSCLVAIFLVVSLVFVAISDSMMMFIISAILSAILFLFHWGGVRLANGRMSRGEDIIAHTFAGVHLMKGVLRSNRLKEVNGRMVPHSVALRFCAVYGMKRMSKLRNTLDGQNGAYYLCIMSERDARASGGLARSEKIFLWGDVCGVAEFCTNDRLMSRASGGSGGSDGGDGGGGE